MLIALDIPVVDVQRRLGYRKPDTTLRVYAHQWKEREARRSQIGQQLGQLFNGNHGSLPASTKPRLALPGVTAYSSAQIQLTYSCLFVSALPRELTAGRDETT